MQDHFLFPRQGPCVRVCVVARDPGDQDVFYRQGAPQSLGHPGDGISPVPGRIVSDSTVSALTNNSRPRSSGYIPDARAPSTPHTQRRLYPFYSLSSLNL